MSDDSSNHATTDQQDSPPVLQLLLFVNHYPSSQEQAKQVIACLNELGQGCAFNLDVVDVKEAPYLAEHYRVVGTPALIKTFPGEPRTLMGNNLIEELRHWWDLWQQSANRYSADATAAETFRDVLDESGSVSKFDALSPTNDDRASQATDIDNIKLPPKIRLNTNFPQSSLHGSAEIIQLRDRIFEIEKEKEALEKQLKSREQVIAVLAHDLRNPITALSLAIQTLEIGYDPQIGWNNRLDFRRIGELLTHAHTQIDKIESLITNILSGMQVQPERLDLRRLCLEVADSMGDRCKHKSLEFKRDIPSDLPYVMADPEKIRQVLINLLDNAIKYTPDGGRITLSALHRTTQEVEVRISDTGPGIPETDQRRIFEDRVRLDRDSHQDGYGIGLALCRRIIEAHRSRIGVDSTLEQGSSFYFNLHVVKP